MSYILLMTSAGSLLYAGQLLLEKAMGEHMSQTCRYRMQAAVLFAYLVPWGWLQYIYRDILPSPFAERGAVQAVSRKLIMDEAVFYTADGLFVTPEYGARLHAVGVWIGTAAVVMLYRCWTYFRNRHDLLKCAVGCGADVPEELVLSLKRELGIKRRVRIVRLLTDRRSFTLGVIRPVVFLQKTGNADEVEHILRHEFTHIARGDLLVKMLMELVYCLHWFNPLVRRMNKRLDRACEKACDESVVRDMPRQEREEYAQLVIKSLQKPGKESKRKLLFGNFFVSNKDNAEERIKVIMNTEKRKLWEKIAVVCAFAVLLFADSLTALAYPKVQEVDARAAEAMDGMWKQEGTLILLGGTESVNAVGVNWDVPILYEQQIITADGEIRPVPEQTRVLCFHKWQDAQYEIHQKHDDGGCTIRLYECTYCPKCESIKIGDLLGNTDFYPCVHNFN